VSFQGALRKRTETKGVSVYRPFSVFIGAILKHLAAKFHPETRENPGVIATRRWIMKQTFLRFLADQSGATAIEYGLIAAGIALAIIAAVNGLGTTLNTTFATINTSLK
jgi:pilus assembly protein Flp/PilA